LDEHVVTSSIPHSGLHQLVERTSHIARSFSALCLPTDFAQDEFQETLTTKK